MGKLISHIQNYPLSEGAVAYNNKLLLEDVFFIHQKPLKDHFKILLEISRDIYFYNDLGSNSNTWNDLLGKEAIFQFSRFLTISQEELYRFFVDLPQINNFNSDVEITQDEYEILAYQRLQVIQYLFSFYKTVGETIADENQATILSFLKFGAISKLFIQYQTLTDECFKEAPILIKHGNRGDAPAFGEILFPAIGDELAASLRSYYNPENITGNLVLTIYATPFQKIKSANEYAHNIFKSIMQIHQAFTAWAANRLNELTSITSIHQPHVALLIAFCKIKMLYDARYDQLIHSNTYFIFHDILQLEKQPVVPDVAFINIGLAKNIHQYLIKKNTFFKAGKNSENKNVFYQSTQDIVLNSAKISYLKSCVRVYKENNLFTITATDDAANPEWQINDAWMPFNDISESYTGIGIQSKLLQGVQKKDIKIDFEFTFNTDIPAVTGIENKCTVILLLDNGTEESLKVSVATSADSIFKISATIEKDLKAIVRAGINTKLKLISPAKNDQDSPYANLYRFLLNEPIAKINVKLAEQNFKPLSIESASGTTDGSSGFIAFGSQSLAGSSFRIVHPFIKYADILDIKIQWEQALKNPVSIDINGELFELPQNDETSTIDDFGNTNSSIKIRLSQDLTYKVESTIKQGTTTSTVESYLPWIVQVKSIELTATLQEIIYDKDNGGAFIEIVSNRSFIKSLRIPYSNKKQQKMMLYMRHINYPVKQYVFRFNNQVAHLYPLGEMNVHKLAGLTFLPDYSMLGFNDFEADLYIGITNIDPGQSISLLFEIADETAGQSELEAIISWFYITNNSFEAIDSSRVSDTTNNFLQSGIVQLSLPDNATNHNTILYGENTYWLVARCDKNHEVVANIRNIKTNGLTTVRVLDNDNRETKKSVPPGTIENIYPKTANIKSVSQNTRSQNGREAETDIHYFWRSSQRLRHKQRAVDQWDFEQIVLEKFPDIYKVKCLNHAYYNESDISISAQPTHTIIALSPHYLVNTANINFQPAIPVSKLKQVKSYLQSLSSAFLKIQVLNSQWDEVRVDLNAVLNKEILDIPYYKAQLDTDIKRFFSPWAFQSAIGPVPSQKIYSSTLVDFIDELSYIHHIKSLKILINNTEVFDEMRSSSEIHFLTAATDNTITVSEYEP